MVMELIRDLSLAGVHMERLGERLRTNAPAGTITDELAERIRLHRDELAELLSDPDRLRLEYAAFVFDAEIEAEIDEEPERHHLALGDAMAPGKVAH